MKKFVVCALLLGLLVAFASPVLAWDMAKQKALGQDKNGSTWYLLDYGKDSNGVPFAVSRRYYTNETLKNQTIELLMSKFAISSEVAGSLYFTEYRYEYTPDGKQYAFTYLRHYDMLGHEIHGTEYGTDENPKTFAPILAGSTPAKGASYALGKTPAAAPKSTSAKSSTVPAKRVVRATKK